MLDSVNLSLTVTMAVVENCNGIFGSSMMMSPMGPFSIKGLVLIPMGFSDPPLAIFWHEDL